MRQAVGEFCKHDIYPKYILEEKNMKDEIMMLTMLALISIGAGAAWGANSTANVTVSATVTSSAKLTLATTKVTFPDADPETVTSIPANENGAVVTAKVKTGSSLHSATLKVLTTDDLKSGSDTIPITNVTSTATNTSGSFFSAGPVTWSKTAPGATVGQGNSGSYAGTFNWFLVNDWHYTVGDYTAQATYTLTTP
jgi:hypothetical protein